MRLNIKNKIVLLVLSVVLLCAGGLSAVSFVKLTDMAEESFLQSSLNELLQVDNYVTDFMQQTMYNAEFISLNPAVRESLGNTPNLTLDKSIEIIDVKTLSDVSKQAYDFFGRVMKTHPSYSYVYTGFEDGGFNQNPVSTLPKGYDPRARPWYKEAVAASKDTSFSKAYQSSTGDPVSTVTAKIYENSKLIGVIGIDIELSTLTDVIRNIKIGNTGYVMLMEADSTILSDPTHKEFLFKKASSLSDAGLDSWKI